MDTTKAYHAKTIDVQESLTHLARTELAKSNSCHFKQIANPTELAGIAATT